MNETNYSVKSASSCTVKFLLAKKDIIFPVMACLLNAKTERIYDNVFNEFQKLIKNILT